MQRKHVVVPAGQDLVADLDDEAMDFVVEAAGGMVGVGGRFFQNGIGGDHFPRHQIPADAEMLERTLGLRAPQLVGGNGDLTETVGFLAKFAHRSLLRETES